MKDLPALNNELTDIADAADRMTSVVEHVQKLHETLEAFDCAHSITITGEGFDAYIMVDIRLESLAPRVRDLPLPMPPATQAAFNAVAEHVLDQAIYEAVTGKALPDVPETILDAAIAEVMNPTVPPTVEAEVTFDDDEGDPVKVSPAWDVAALPDGGAVYTPPGPIADPDPVSEFGSTDAGLAEAEAKPLAEAVGGVDAAPPAAAIAATRFDVGRWTPEEDAIVSTNARKGMSDQDIALLLPGRTVKAVALRRIKLRNQNSQSASLPVAPPPPAPRPAEPVAVLPDAPAFDDKPRGAVNAAERALDWRLEQLGNKGKWSDPGADLALVRDLTKGIKLAQITLDLGIDAQVCKFRFEQLVPNPTIEEQTAVLRALERRVAAFKSKAA